MASIHKTPLGNFVLRSKNKGNFVSYIAQKPDAVLKSDLIFSSCFYLKHWYLGLYIYTLLASFRTFFKTFLRSYVHIITLTFKIQDFFKLYFGTCLGAWSTAPEKHVQQRTFKTHLPNYTLTIHVHNIKAPQCFLWKTGYWKIQVCKMTCHVK